MYWIFLVAEILKMLVFLLFLLSPDHSTLIFALTFCDFLLTFCVRVLTIIILWAHMSIHGEFVTVST